jgi:hypothetical protein
MKRTVFHILSVTALTAALTVTLVARQAEVPPPAHPRGAAQQAQRGAAKAAKQAQQLPQNLAADQPSQPNQPNPAKRNEQVQRNRITNAVVDHYLGGFQKGVGLDDDQTRKFSPILGNYVRRQLTLADRRNQAMNQLKSFKEQKAPEEEIQAQSRILDETEAQQINAKRKFYADVNPELSVQQRANLKVYMDSTEQSVREAIQKSRNDSPPGQEGR